MDVGVRELKAKLSEYLHKAAAGERITVTDRGKPLAQLVSMPNSNSQVQRGVDEGWIEPPRRTALTEPVLFNAVESTASALDEDRG